MARRRKVSSQSRGGRRSLGCSRTAGRAPARTAHALVKPMKAPKAPRLGAEPERRAHAARVPFDLVVFAREQRTVRMLERLLRDLARRRQRRLILLRILATNTP